ncbi:unnamed protein product [Darwinula stevensoni]|uniref:CUB domain-containing protein n=1 Tax=Darwinula stevensoni TaxID=69355 RepID=A0A7R8ZYM1_9CRUS|nr:unnamed protein product [Darwinula stevensoni]CAG0881781.1 unnamed protein product [Darwinula stevensoni]
MRLDFVDFNLQGATVDGLCANDLFTVLGGTSVAPSICGVNTGNHMYVDVGQTTNSVSLTVTTSGSSFPRSWKIKVTQLPCNTNYLAGSGCLQFHTGVTGQVMTYNFNSALGQELANQDYGICIRMEAGYCGIQYATCTVANETFTQAFSVSGTTVNTNPSSQTGSANCPFDWVVIPCLTNAQGAAGATQVTPFATQPCVDRICGTFFSSGQGQGAPPAYLGPYYSYRKPFVIYYHTNGQETAQNDLGNRGFCLRYTQQPCTGTVG